MSRSQHRGKSGRGKNQPHPSLLGTLSSTRETARVSTRVRQQLRRMRLCALRAINATAAAAEGVTEQIGLLTAFLCLPSIWIVLPLGCVFARLFLLRSDAHRARRRHVHRAALPRPTRPFSHLSSLLFSFFPRSPRLFRAHSFPLRLFLARLRRPADHSALRVKQSSLWRCCVCRSRRLRAAATLSPTFLDFSSLSQRFLPDRPSRPPSLPRRPFSPCYSAAHTHDTHATRRTAHTQKTRRRRPLSSLSAASIFFFNHATLTVGQGGAPCVFLPSFAPCPRPRRRAPLAEHTSHQSSAARYVCGRLWRSSGRHSLAVHR